MNNLLVYDRHFFPAMDPDSMAETVIILRSLMSTFENHLPLAARPWILVDPERYGYRRDAEVSHPFDGQLAQVPSPAGRGLESFLHDLNCFLLDGAITDGTQCRFQKKFHPMAWYQIPRAGTKADIVKEICRSAVGCRLEQYLADGNHRTNTLCVFELFAALGLRVDGSPLRVYTILSLGEDLGQEATTQLLTNFLVRRVEYKAISTEYIKTYRQQTKELPVWATQVFQIWKALENRTAPLSARQQAFRKLKKTHVEVYKAVEILVTKGGKTEYSVSA